MWLSPPALLYCDLLGIPGPHFTLPWERLGVHLYEQVKVMPPHSLTIPSSPVFQLMGWIFEIDSPTPFNLPSIALLIPVPEMKGTNHTGVYNQTSKVVYKGS